MECDLKIGGEESTTIVDVYNADPLANHRTRLQILFGVIAIYLLFVLMKLLGIVRTFL